jgi:hypothetical protein
MSRGLEKLGLCLPWKDPLLGSAWGYRRIDRQRVCVAEGQDLPSDTPRINALFNAWQLRREEFASEAAANQDQAISGTRK